MNKTTNTIARMANRGTHHGFFPVTYSRKGRPRKDRSYKWRGGRWGEYK